MDNSFIELTGSAIGGTTLATLLARAFISRSMQDLKEAVQKIGSLEVKLENLTVRLEELYRSHQQFRELDRKVVAIETKINGRFNKH
jgi:uncharacterized protein involved in exopolysaccharide biosynthesis